MTDDAAPPSTRVIVIAGPTACGKSALALTLAERIGGEILCADSRQVYAGLAIASACPTPAERERVPHHGFGAIDPNDKFTAARFIAFADDTIRAIQGRGRTPILVGGTGLYLRAWRLGLDDPSAPKDMDAMLARDPRPIAQHAAWLLLDANIAHIEARILVRAQEMFTHGIVEEARAFQARVPAGHPLLDTLGIAEALALAYPESLHRTAVRTRQYAKRQRTWFKKEPWWHVLRADTATAQLVEDALSFLARAG